MSITVEAVYEAGILRPLTPLPALAEQAKVRVTIEPAEKPIPQVRSREHPVNHTGIASWLQQHRDEYRGQWIVLDGDRLLGHSANPDDIDEVFKQARAEGVSAPFVKLIPLDDEPIWPGIL